MVIFSNINVLLFLKFLAQAHGPSIHHPAVVGEIPDNCSLVERPDLEMLQPYCNEILVRIEYHFIDFFQNFVLAYSRCLFPDE